MIKNWIICIEAAIILAMSASWYASMHMSTPVRLFRLPKIQLGENERITQVEVSFQAASIRSIRNIPAGWDVRMDLGTPNPVFSGSIIVGAAALGSTAELPAFELEGYTNDIEPRPQKAVLMVASYPGDIGKERRVVLQLGKP
jgi:hypothetical protein